jgi:3-hydroxy-3-methylglutaryl CoA synthase
MFGIEDTEIEKQFNLTIPQILPIMESMIFEIESSSFITLPFMDYWRLEYDKIIRWWEERLCREVGYFPYMSKAIQDALDQAKLTVADVSKAVIYSPITACTGIS